MLLAYSPWGKIPVVVVRNPAADAECGGEGTRGTASAPLHRQPLRLGHMKPSRPMAAGEPVTTRVQFLAEAVRGHSKCFRVSFAQVSHDEELSERIGQGVVNQQQGLVE